jgi:hypothetical protein
MQLVRPKAPKGRDVSLRVAAYKIESLLAVNRLAQKPPGPAPNRCVGVRNWVWELVVWPLPCRRTTARQNNSSTGRPFLHRPTRLPRDDSRSH